MKRVLLVILLGILITGCATTKTSTGEVNNTASTTCSNCKKVAPMWYGQKGENPQNNDVWKCYDWELTAQK